MGKKLFFILIILVFFVPFLYSRLLFIGPNPYFSFATFPQDARLFKNKTIIFLNYDKRGWMGNLDFPELSPSPTYVATEESISENFDSTMAEAGFKGTWLSPSMIFIPFMLEVSSFRIVPIVTGQWDSFKLTSSGIAIGREGDEKMLIPFSSELSQRNKTYTFGTLITTSLGEVPIGLIINYKKFSEGRPSGYLKYSFEGEEKVLSRYNWGWSTVAGCNHIFGVSTNIDAFWQDEYIDTRYSQFDMVLGADFGENKIGFRLRKQWGQESYYKYEDSINNYVKSK